MNYIFPRGKITLRTSRTLLLSVILVLLIPAISAQPDYSNEELAEKFAPEVNLHPEEPYEPINAEWYIRNSELKNSEEDSVIEASPDIKSLNRYDSENYYLDIEDNYINPETYPDYSSNAQETVYYRVKDVEGRKVLQYWFFYPFSEYKLNGYDTKITEHDSDWEMVQFVLNEERYNFPEGSGYAQHYIGKVSHWTQQPKDGTTPKVYPAEKGHATYYARTSRDFNCETSTSYTEAVSKLLLDQKTACTGSEPVGAGRSLEPENYELKNLKDQAWINWDGKWSSKGNPGPKGKKDYFGNNVWQEPIEWLREREPYETNAGQADYNPPSANLDKPEEVNPGEEVIFNGFGSDEQSYLEYHWDIENEDYQITQRSDLSYSFEDGGDYSIELSVVDNEGASTSEEILYHVNQYPLPEFSLLQSTVKTFEEVSIDESSSDPDGVISERIWDFGQQEATGSNPQISFEDDGIYEINLTVIDDDDLGNSVTKKVSVLNRKPNVDVSVNPDQIYYDTQVQFASESSDRDGRITETTWYIDGQKYSESESFEKTFSNATGGVSTYQVELMVEDDDNDRNSTTRTIEIANRDPSSDFKMNATEVKVGEPIEIGSQAHDEDGNITGLSWNLGDGTSKQSKEFTYSYENPGTYEVELTVTDSAGAKSSTIKEIEVNKEGLLEGVTGSGSESGDQESSGVVESVINSIIGVFS